MELEEGKRRLGVLVGAMKGVLDGGEVGYVERLVAGIEML